MEQLVERQRRGQHGKSPAPDIPVFVTVCGPVGERLRTASLVFELRETLRRALVCDAESLGVPARPVVDVDVTSRVDGDILAVAVDGARCRRPPTFSDDIVRRSSGLTTGELAGADARVLIRTLVSLARELVHGQPSNLLTEVAVGRYLGSLDEPETGGQLDVRTLRPVLASLVDLRISIANRQVVREALVKVAAGPPVPVLEVLVERLRRPAVEIIMCHESLKTVTCGTISGARLFLNLRETLYNELGARYPDFTFVLSEQQPPDTFAFRLNDLATAPYRFSADADADARLRYLVQQLGVQLRRQPTAFLHVGIVRDALVDLELAYPTLIQLLKEEMSAEEVTSLLRSFLEENVSIRDMRTILEVILNANGVDVGDRDYVTLDSRLPDGDLPSRDTRVVLSSLRLNAHRARLRYVLHGERRVRVHRVSPRIEKLVRDFAGTGAAGLAAVPGASDGIADEVLAAVWAAGGGNAPENPLLVSSVELHRPMRRLLSPVAPGLAVWAQQEIPLGIEVEWQTEVA